MGQGKKNHTAHMKLMMLEPLKNVCFYLNF